MLEVMKDDNYIYYFTMERKGKHHGDQTIFTLKQIDLEDMTIREVLQHSYKDYYCEQNSCEFLATTIEIIKNHSINQYEVVKSIQKQDREELAK